MSAKRFPQLVKPGVAQNEHHRRQQQTCGRAIAWKWQERAVVKILRRDPHSVFVPFLIVPDDA
jgi:hypothetical protein